MNAETRIRIDATTTVTLSEKELAVWTHLSGYDPLALRANITRTISDEDLREVARTLRGKLEHATATIARARNALAEVKA